MRRLKIRWVIWAAASLASTAYAHAQRVDMSGMTACTLTAWSSDPDPAGLNIRSAPQAEASVIGRAPPPEEQDGERIAAEFSIAGSRNGWFLVRDVKYTDYGNGKGDRIVFKGPGWIFADRVRFTIYDPAVRSAPTRTAKVLATLRSKDGTSDADSAIIERVFGCSGAFADVSVHMDGQRPTRGWVTNLCSNQVTTCP